MESQRAALEPVEVPRELRAADVEQLAAPVEPVVAPAENGSSPSESPWALPFLCHTL